MVAVDIDGVVLHVEGIAAGVLELAVDVQRGAEGRQIHPCRGVDSGDTRVGMGMPCAMTMSGVHVGVRVM